MTGTDNPTEPSRDPRTGGPHDARGLRLVPALLALTALSGLIDAVTYLGLGHVFTANMTGNVVVLGFAAAGAPGFSVPHTAASLVCFLTGAMAGGRVTRRTAARSRRSLARLTLGVEALLLAAAAAVAAAASDDAPATVYSIIALTAFAMGLRNATVRKLAVRGLTTTTVVTMTLTGLAADSRAGDGTRPRSPRRAASVTAMFAGAFLGAVLVLHHDLALPLLAAATTSAVLALTVSGRD
ncbi:YoaK family protein [Streptomyces scabiei]|uniref:YoaK family protein n=1 Tax=Streptomyces scabiei TaxID=1930 RepID=UPI00299FF071|nr:YoaK family protein [Streptomyces scabiei]MDX3118388.1 YoaK family protein [Streptomyces scabiei]